MEGLEFRLKTFESLNRKLIADGINTPMNDALRYTIIIDKEITIGVNTILKGLESKGYQTIKIKNTFKEGQIYKGINTNVKSPEGNIFEIQYHTSESFNVKQNINHILYEKYRLLPDDSAEAIDLVNQMMKNSNSVKLPKDINTIK
jgi:predicted RNA methylase